MIIPIWQMRKLKSKEVWSLVKRFTATKKQNQELTSPQSSGSSHNAHAVFFQERVGMIWFSISLTTDLISDECHFLWMGCRKWGGGWSFPESKVELIRGRIHSFFFFLSDSLVEKTWIKLPKPTGCISVKGIFNCGKSRITGWNTSSLLHSPVTAPLHVPSWTTFPSYPRSFLKSPASPGPGNLHFNSPSLSSLLRGKF